jgi:phage-related protein
LGWVFQVRFTVFAARSCRCLWLCLASTQDSKKHTQAKVLKGFGGSGVLEVAEDCLGNTYRAAYTVKIADGVYVLHCFHKKSFRGIATPKPDIDLICERLKTAYEHVIGSAK